MSKVFHNFRSTGIDDNATETVLTLDDSGFTLNGEVAADGFQFPATQVPSADVNNLDDYEEGSWTPVLYGTTTTGTPTYSTQNGTYVKIGKMVFARCYVVLSNIGGAVGGIRVSGLPFTNQSSLSSGNIGYTINANLTGGESLDAYVPQSSSLLLLRVWDVVGGQTALIETEITNTFAFAANIAYEV